jgi:outer membrane biosynthesis protein TonB
MNLRPLQLVIGWLVLCAFTAGGTYYGLVELDQEIGLQSRLYRAQPTPVPTGAPTPTTAPTPLPTGTPPPGPTPTPYPTSYTPQPTPTPFPTYAPQPTGRYQPTPTPTPVPTPVPTFVTRPTPYPTQSPGPGPVSGNVVTRFNALNDRATEIIGFYQRLQQDLAAQRLPLRSDIKAAWAATVSNLQRAQSALRSGDAAGASRAMDQAEEKIEFLENSK